MMSREQKTTIREEDGTDRLVLKQIQTAPNRRILSSMPPFRLDADLPDDMMRLLRQLQSAEHGNQNRQRRAG